MRVGLMCWAMMAAMLYRSGMPGWLTVVFMTLAALGGFALSQKLDSIARALRGWERRRG